MSYFGDKCVLVTGAASGIGAATAKLFLDSGAAVVGCDIRAFDADGESAFDQAEYHFVQTDVTVQEQVALAVKEAIDRFGAVDVLVNCAGVGLVRPLLETTLTEFDRVMAANVRGVFLMGREVIAAMLQRKSGRVINVASELALLGRRNASVYCATKGAVVSMTRSWAREFAPDVLVNAVAPGPVDTPLLGFDRMEPELAKCELDNPMGRIGRPEEIAHAIRFLAGPGASYMTGQTIGVDGGAAMY